MSFKLKPNDPNRKVLKIPGLAQEVAALTELPYQTCLTIVTTTLETMKAALLSGEDVQILGWGHLFPYLKAAHNYQNVSTRAPYTQPARRTVFFNPSRETFYTINQKGHQLVCFSSSQTPLRKL